MSRSTFRRADVFPDQWDLDLQERLMSTTSGNPNVVATAENDMASRAAQILNEYSRPYGARALETVYPNVLSDASLDAIAASREASEATRALLDQPRRVATRPRLLPYEQQTPLQQEVIRLGVIIGNFGVLPPDRFKAQLTSTQRNLEVLAGLR